MSAISSSALLTVLALLVVVGCAGMGPPASETGYRANVTVRRTDASGAGMALERVVEFYSMGNRRREARVDGQRVTLIDRPDLRISWMLNPATKSFEEYRLRSPEAAISGAPNPFGPRAKAVFEWLGTEDLGGLDTQKFAVEGIAISGHAWFTTDLIPVRFVGTLDTEESRVELEIEYTEVERHSQAAFLFTIPPNYAGYETRKQKSVPSDREFEDALIRLREEARRIPRPHLR